MKSAQGAIKILLKSDLSSDLIHFLAIFGGPGASQKQISYAPGFSTIVWLISAP